MIGRLPLAVVLALAALLTWTSPARAHVVSNRDCAVYAKVAAVMGGNRKASGRRCRAAALDHAHAHCQSRRGGYRVRNACTIRLVFRPAWRGEQAVRVARCESGLRTWALGPRDERGNRRPGLFQLGTYERSKAGNYTVVSSARVQAESARAWQRLTGGGWSAWECRP